MHSASSADANRVHIFDTTLRDGEQSPGISLNTQEKVEIAQQLARLGVDVIEAGFPITSPGDFEAVQEISRKVEGPVICGLARTHKADIDAAWGAIRMPRDRGSTPSSRPPTSTSSTSCRPPATTSRARRARRWRWPGPIATTSSSRRWTHPRRHRVHRRGLRIAVDEGATVINIPDTVGYTTPEEYAAYFRRLYELVPGPGRGETSVHCHDDLGMAVANSYAGVLAGARRSSAR